MKNYLYAILFVAFAFSACSKGDSGTYETSSRATTTTTSSSSSSSTITSSRGNAPGGSGSTTTPTPAPTPVYGIAFNNANQAVKVSLSNKTLTMNFYENVNLYARKDSLTLSWAIIFTENFSGSQLAKYNYTTVGKSGATTTNFAESNLNNVVISATKDTVINSFAYTKFSFNRNFIFTNTYNTSTEAGVEYDYLLAHKETVTFAAYITTPSGTSSNIKSNSTLVYSSN